MLLSKHLSRHLAAIALASLIPASFSAALPIESEVAKVSQNGSIFPFITFVPITFDCREDWPSESKEKAPWEDKICPTDSFPEADCLPPDLPVVKGKTVFDWPTKSTEKNCCYFNYACYNFFKTIEERPLKQGSEEWKKRHCCWEQMNSNPTCINPPGPPHKEDVEFLPPPYCIN